MSTKDRVQELLRNLMERSPDGFAVGVHVGFTSSKFLFQTYHEAWMEEYSRRGLIVKDPTVKWGLTNDGSITWTELAKIDEEGVLEEAEKHGLRYGVTIAITENGTKSLGSFASGEGDFEPDVVKALEENIRELHYLTSDENLDPKEAAKIRNIAIASTHS